MTDFLPNEKPTMIDQVLYIKEGRRYVPWGNLEDRSYFQDVMEVGTFKLVHCVENGHYRYRHDVTPDSAAFVAAAMIALDAMEKAMLEKAKSNPNKAPMPWTQRQKELIENFRSDMAATGALVPTYWTTSTAYEIAMAGIEAVKQTISDDQS